MYKESSHHTFTAFVPHILFFCNVHMCWQRKQHTIIHIFIYLFLEQIFCPRLTLILDSMVLHQRCMISSLDGLKFGGAFYASRWQTCSPRLIYPRQLGLRIFFICFFYIFALLHQMMGSRIPWKGKLNMRNRRLDSTPSAHILVHHECFNFERYA